MMAGLLLDNNQVEKGFDLSQAVHEQYCSRALMNFKENSVFSMVGPRVPTCDELCARAARAHSLFNFKEICTNSVATFGKNISTKFRKFQRDFTENYYDLRLRGQIVDLVENWTKFRGEFDSKFGKLLTHARQAVRTS